MYIFAHKYFCISRPFPFWCKGMVGSCKQTWVGMSGCVNTLTRPCTSRSRREKMKPSLQRVERNDVAFLGRKEKAFLVGNQYVPMMTYCLKENLIIMLLWPLHVVVVGICLFVCFILNSLSRFLCLARLFSFKTHLCSNCFQCGLRVILSQHPAPITIFAISLLC